MTDNMMEEQPSVSAMTDHSIMDQLSNITDCANLSPDDLRILAERIENNMKREEIVKKHNHNVWQEKSGRWNTYLDDPEAARGFRKISRKTRKEIVDELVQYYNPESVKDVYEDWIQFKREYERIKEQSLTRYDNDYRRFFKGTEFEKLPIKRVTESQLRMFVVKNIKEKGLTAKTFAGLRLLLNGIFKHAKYEGKTNISISSFFADLDVHGMFKPPSKRTEAYSDLELQKIVRECLAEGDVIALMITLNIQAGTRIGECTACRWTDVNFKHATLSINSTAVSYKDPVSKKRVHKIQETPKTEAGERVILLTDTALKTLRRLYLLTGQNEFICSDPNDGHIIESNTLRKRLEKICAKIGVKYRGTHAARRTMGTKLLNSGMPDDLVRKQMGHSDIETTRKYYNRDRTDPETARKQLNQIINY